MSTQLAQRDVGVEKLRRALCRQDRGQRAPRMTHEVDLRLVKLPAEVAGHRQRFTYELFHPHRLQRDAGEIRIARAALIPVDNGEPALQVAVDLPERGSWEAGAAMHEKQDRVVRRIVPTNQQPLGETVDGDRLDPGDAGRGRITLSRIEHRASLQGDQHNGGRQRCQGHGTATGAGRAELVGQTHESTVGAPAFRNLLVWKRDRGGFPAETASWKDADRPRR